MNLKTDSKLLKQGAEARLYVDYFCGRPSVVKERFVKKYRHPKLDESLTRERIKSECRALLKCSAAGIKTPGVYFVDLEDRKIIMEYVTPSVTVGEYMQNVMSENRDERKIQKILFPLMEKFGKTLRLMHDNSIIHGDLTTSNALLRGSADKLELVLIDFGLSSFCDSTESKAVDLYVLERAFLSSHPNTETLFSHLLSNYSKIIGDSDVNDILKKLDEVRLRGRKRIMVG